MIVEAAGHSSKKFQIFKFWTWIGLGKVNRRGLDLLLFFQVFPSSDVVFVLPADEVYEKDLLKSGFPQQSSVTSSSEPAGARPPFVSNFDNITRFIG